MKKIIFIAICVSIILLIACNKPTNGFKTLTIDQTELQVELADTPQKRGQGLSGRQSLCKDCGMLFVFNEPTILDFWMKDMNFPLDIIWIKDNVVVGFKENIPPMRDISQPVYYRPNEPITSALELPAGWVQNHQIKIGDIVKY